MEFGAADPMIRLEEMPEHGVMQYMQDGEWVDMQVGVEYPADTEVQYVGHADEIQGLTAILKLEALMAMMTIAPLMEQLVQVIGV